MHTKTRRLIVVYIIAAILICTALFKTFRSHSFDEFRLVDNVLRARGIAIPTNAILRHFETRKIVNSGGVNQIFAELSMATGDANLIVSNSTSAGRFIWRRLNKLEPVSSGAPAWRRVVWNGTVYSGASVGADEQFMNIDIIVHDQDVQLFLMAVQRANWWQRGQVQTVD